MSRFSNLEFEGEHEDHLNGLQTPECVEKDEAYYVEQATTAFEIGQFEPALRYYARALEHNPRSAASWVGQVRALIEIGEHREARLWSDKALETLPDEPELLAAKAVALARQGELHEALAFSDAAMMSGGQTAYLWLARADVMLARKERMADYCFDKALLVEAGNWVVAWLGSRIRTYYKQFAAALKLAQKAIEWNATQQMAWVQLGRCQKATGLTTTARTSFKRALEIAPDCHEARQAIGQLGRTGLWARWRQMFALKGSQA